MSAETKKGMSYKGSGVDIDQANEFVSAIKPIARTTRRPGADAILGGFGGFFDLKASGYNDPLLVASTDGVGTKLKLAAELGMLEKVGIDLVAMCANDIITHGAEPLFLLNYMATDKLDVERMKTVISGIAEGCRITGMAMIGGETAELPGLIAEGNFDLAGFTLGAVERGNIVNGDDIKPGDKILGLVSSGPHANGYSLIRQILKKSMADLEALAPFCPKMNLGEELLTPTRLYVRSILSTLKHHKVNGIAHITGGGLLENIARILPSGLSVNIDANLWPLPRVFEWLQQEGQLSPRELGRTFNCGIGMVVIVPAENEQAIMRHLEQEGETVYPLGAVQNTPGQTGCSLHGRKYVWGANEDWRISNITEYDETA